MFNVLIVGVGSIGERHLRAFRATGRAAVALCETDEARRQEVSRRCQVDRCYGDLEAAASDADHRFDAAVIATPAPLHVSMAERLARAGVHLLIEKPLSTTLEGTDDLVKVVAENRILAAVAYVCRAHPALQAMRQALADDRFGKPVQLVAVTGQHFPTYRPAYRATYYTRRETGGGAIQDALTHVINMGEYLVGPVDRVTADGAHQIIEDVEVEDTAHVLARHGDVLGSYALNQYQAPNESTITVVCARGTARFEMHRHRWLSMTEPGADWDEEEVFAGDRDAVFVNQANHFLDAVEGKSPPLCSLADGLHTLRVNLAVLAAAQAPPFTLL